MKWLLFLLAFCSQFVQANSIAISLEMNHAGGLEVVVDGQKLPSPQHMSSNYFKERKGSVINVSSSSNIPTAWLLDYVNYLSELDFHDIYVTIPMKIPSNSKHPVEKHFRFQFEGAE